MDLDGAVGGSARDGHATPDSATTRRHRFSSQQERRWALAEELGHVLLDHRLVESTQPGKPTMGLLEVLMPFFDVRKRSFAISRERPVEGELSLEDRVKRLADEFGVTPMAMRVRFEQMKRVPSVAKETRS